MLNPILGKSFGIVSRYKIEDDNTVEVFIAAGPKKAKDVIGSKLIKATFDERNETITIKTREDVIRYIDLMDKCKSVTLTVGPNCHNDLNEATITLQKGFNFRLLQCLHHSSYHGGIKKGFNSPGHEYGECEVCGKEIHYFTDPKPSVESLKKVFFY